MSNEPARDDGVERLPTQKSRIVTDELNRILWRWTKGPDVPYPAPIHRAILAKR